MEWHISALNGVIGLGAATTSTAVPSRARTVLVKSIADHKAFFVGSVMGDA